MTQIDKVDIKKLLDEHEDVSVEDLTKAILYLEQAILDQQSTASRDLKIVKNLVAQIWTTLSSKNLGDIDKGK